MRRPETPPFTVLANRKSRTAETGIFIAFSSEVDTGSRQENALNQNHRAPLLIP
jgi:hypothetical protein